MILEYDENLENLVNNFIPRWTELRLRKRDFSEVDENSFVTSAILLSGEHSLLCSMTSKDLVRPRIEYYPIYLKVVDQAAFDLEEWITLARAGGTSDFERKVQWLFDKPSLRLMVSQDDLRDRFGQRYILKFYGGLEIANPLGKESLKIEAPDLPDFVVHAKFLF